MDKAKLREITLARQKSLQQGERSELSRRIARLFFGGVDLSGTRVIHCYIPIEKFKEIDTTPVFNKLWRDFPEIQTFVPRVNFESGEIDNVRFGPASTLAENLWGIHEPADVEDVDTAKIDLVLVPGLAFDLLGHRVGYGRGFYDRFLAKCRADCIKIGLSYFEPVERIGDTHAGDATLDFLITPRNIIKMPHRNAR